MGISTKISPLASVWYLRFGHAARSISSQDSDLMQELMRIWSRNEYDQTRDDGSRHLMGLCIQCHFSPFQTVVEVQSQGLSVFPGIRTESVSSPPSHRSCLRVRVCFWFDAFQIVGYVVFMKLVQLLLVIWDKRRTEEHEVFFTDQQRN